MFTVERIDHVEVYVRDPEGSARWYAEVLGLREVYRWDPEPIMIGAGGTMLALFQAPAGAPPVPEMTQPVLRWSRVAFRTDRKGFEIAQRSLTDLNIPFRGPVDHQIAWSIYFSDPDGHPLEITYYDEVV
jgi:catechol 2,3-dioxygenase-like lactoylglutathione lyase family enzyme